jgi:hypothetical protein
LNTILGSGYTVKEYRSKKPWRVESDLYGFMSQGILKPLSDNIRVSKIVCFQIIGEFK